MFRFELKRGCVVRMTMKLVDPRQINWNTPTTPMKSWDKKRDLKPQGVWYGRETTQEGVRVHGKRYCRDHIIHRIYPFAQHCGIKWSSTNRHRFRKSPITDYRCKARVWININIESLHSKTQIQVPERCRRKEIRTIHDNYRDTEISKDWS